MAKYIIPMILAAVIILLVGCEELIEMKEDLIVGFKGVKLRGDNKTEEETGKSITIKKISCEEKAKEMITPYMVLSDDRFEKDTFDYWFRSGSREGENINYFYYVDGRWKEDKGMTYSKKIINKDGLVLGTTNYSYRPVLKLSDKNILYEEVSEEELSEEGIYWVEWSGFTEEIKEILGTESINVKFVVEDVVAWDPSKTRFVICDESSTGEEDIITCDIESSEGLKNHMQSRYWSRPKFMSILSFEDSKIYNILEYNFDYCNWVEED